MPEPQQFRYNVPAATYPTTGWGGVFLDGVPVVDELLVEFVEPNKEGYIRLPEGSRHPDTVNYPNHRLLKEEMVEYGTNKRYWCNGFRNQDQYNYDIAYSGESNSHPIFQRRYLVRRDQYVPFGKFTKFTGIYLIEITLTGSGYDPKAPPAISIVGGGGGGATANAIVGETGTLDWIYLTNEGSGYTSEPTVNIAGAGGAAATAKINADTQVLASVTVPLAGTGTGWPANTTAAVSGGGGSGATVVPQVLAGKIRAVNVTANGTGFTSVPSIVFTGAGGSGASVTAVLETVSIQLVKEDVQQFPEDDPRRSLFVIVVRSYEALPGPVLIEHKYNAYLDRFTSSLKRIVSAATVPADMTFVTQPAGQITEYQPLSKIRSVQIISKINPLIAWENGGADEVSWGTAPYTFPNEIHDDPIVTVVYAYDGSSNLVIDFGWELHVIEGYSGPCLAKFVRRYTFDPDNPAFIAALPQVTYIKPEGAVIFEGFIYVGGNLIARATKFVIPSTLHPQLNVTVAAAPPVGTMEGPLSVIPATIPTSIPAGTEIVVSVKPTKYLFGLTVYDIVSIFAPTPPP